MSTKADLDYLIKPATRQTIAENILNGIGKYAQQILMSRSDSTSFVPDNTPSSFPKNDFYTIPDALIIVDGKTATKAEADAIDPENIQSVHVLKAESAIKIYGEKGKNGVIEIHKKPEGFTKMAIVKKNRDTAINPVYFVDGKGISATDVLNINTNNIASVTVWKGGEAIKKFGEMGKGGVIEITTKPPGSSKNDTIPDKVFTKVENEADFPGGREACATYISGRVKAAFDSLKVIEAENYGTCLVKFIVNTDGSVSHVEATTMEGTRLSDIAVNAIRTGPKWIPASQNNHTVASYRLQPVTLTKPK